MKKIILIASLIVVAFSSTSCKKKAKKDAAAKQEITIDASKTVVNWTAYKTTQKVPVKGQFQKLIITKNGSGNTPSDALNGTEFSIPVSSIFSNNPDRDHKLKTLFFGVMKNAEVLSGTIHIENDNTGFVDFNMNGVIEKLPFSYTQNGSTLEIQSVMHTDTWQAQAAIESINKACFELHKGPDGVSKTWSDVGINISVAFK